LSRGIKIHSKEDFEYMRRAGQLAASVLDFIAPYVKVGVTTEYLDDLCHDFIVDHGAVPVNVGYRGYPKTTCISVNHVICHGIPDGKVLANGDILNIDVALTLDGWFGDTSRMFWAGDVKLKGRKLTDVTYECLMRAIKVVKPGATLGDIGHAIQSYAEANRYSVVVDFCGHGLGQVYHDEPNVIHAGRKGEGTVLKEGMFFTIEPMINTGRPDCKILSDGWTAVTRDRSLSAQFEHAIGVTKDGYEIFSTSPKGLHKPPYNV
jgi:methionyl aminopeptidase